MRSGASLNWHDMKKIIEKYNQTFNDLLSNLDTIKELDKSFDKPIQLLEKVSMPNVKERQQLLGYYESKRQITAAIKSLSTFNGRMKSFGDSASPLGKFRSGIANVSDQEALSRYKIALNELRDMTNDTVTIFNSLMQSYTVQSFSDMSAAQRLISEIDECLKDQKPVVKDAKEENEKMKKSAASLSAGQFGSYTSSNSSDTGVSSLVGLNSLSTTYTSSLKNVK